MYVVPYTKKYEFGEVLEKNINIKNYPKIGRGSYGSVYTLGKIVYKEFYFRETTTVPDSFIMESSIYNQLKNCDCVVKYDDSYINGDKFGITMKKYEFDMNPIIAICDSKLIKKIIYQILYGLCQAHSKFIIHRDIKPENIMIDKNFDAAIGDWGMSKINYDDYLADNEVQTIWYRAPEVLFEKPTQCGKMDIWSVGIIMIDMLMMKKGNIAGYNVTDQAKEIFSNLGFPNESDLKLYSDKIKYHKIKKDNCDSPLYLKGICKNRGICESGVNLLNNLLQYDPDKRISALDAINHSFFFDIHGIYPIININCSKSLEISELDVDIDGILENNEWIVKNKIVKYDVIKYFMIYYGKIIGLCQISLAIKVFDYITGIIKMTSDNVMIYATTIMGIIIKLFTSIALKYKKMCELCQISYIGSKSFMKYESYILEKLKWNIYYRTPMFIFMKYMGNNTDEFTEIMKYMLIMVMYNYDYTMYDDTTIVKTIYEIIIKNMKDSHKIESSCINILENLNGVCNILLAKNICYMHNKNTEITSINNILRKNVIGFCQKKIFF